MKKLLSIGGIFLSISLAIFWTTARVKATIPGHANCNDCHSAHGTPGQSLTDNGSVEVLCQSCHYPSSPKMPPGYQLLPTNHRDSDTSPTFEMSCTKCHEPHNYQQNILLSNNLELVRGTVATPDSGSKSVIFINRGSDAPDHTFSQYSFANADTNYTGICEACHTTTTYHTNNGYLFGTTTPVASHNRGNFCIRCHAHDKGFRPSSCIDCHKNPQTGTHGITRRAVCSPTDSSTICTGEFSLPGHHGGSSVTTDDCAVCHMEAVNGTYHANGEVDLRNPDTGDPIPVTTGYQTGFAQFSRFTGLGSGTTGDGSATLEAWVTNVQNNFCLKCHDSDGATFTKAGSNALQPFSSTTRNVPNVSSRVASNAFNHAVLAAGSNPYTTATAANGNTTTMVFPWNQGGTHNQISCFDCHGVPDGSGIVRAIGHGSPYQRMLRSSIDLNTMESTVITGKTSGGGFGTIGASVLTFCTSCHKVTSYQSGNTGSKFAYHSSQTNHLYDGGNTLGCMGCHGGIVDAGGLGVSNGAARGNIHGASFTWPSQSGAAGSTTRHFILGGWMSGWSYATGTTSCWGGYCNHNNSPQSYGSGTSYTLTVNSTNPASGVPINVTPADNSAQGNGSTSFTRTYDSGTTVTLTAPATASGPFSSWAGCDSALSTTCTVAMSAAKTVTANYTLTAYTLTVNKAGTGSGTVTSSPSGINCGATCSASFTGGTSVTLTPTASGGSAFVGWSGGGCSGTGNCTLTMNAATTVTATFNLAVQTTYNTAGNHDYVAPGNGIVIVEIWAGGGGGGGNSSSTDGGGGACGGAYVKSSVITVTNGTTYNCRVGDYGAGKAGSTGSGSNGGASWFCSGSACTVSGNTGWLYAVGGQGGLSQNGTLPGGTCGVDNSTASGGTYSATKYRGGYGGAGRDNNSGSGGGGGEGACTTQAGNTGGTGTSGAGGAGGTGCDGGDGGTGGTIGNGNPGTQPGGGGGGAGDASGATVTGGNGGVGRCIVTFTAAP